jgi:putative restriction endonuclease
MPAYLTIDPADRRTVVSSRIKEEFENGRECYRLHGECVREPAETWAKPLAKNLAYRAHTIFL